VLLRIVYSVVRSFTRRRSIDLHGLLSAMESSASDSLAYIEEQQRMAREAADCARARGGSLWFVHDMLSVDLAGGRSPARQEMLGRRQLAVESAGGHFIDILAEAKDAIGISWFADVMHLSAIGHEEVAARACAAMSASIRDLSSGRST
jgi:hypothetical protein